MPQPFNIQFYDKEIGEKVQVKGEFPDQEWSLLLKFKDYAEELLSSQIVQKGIRIKYNFSWDARKGHNVNTEMPPDDDIAAFLHRMRPFVLQNEPTEFFKICKILSRRLNYPKLRAMIKRQHRLFSGEDFLSQIQIKINDVMLNTDSTLKKWLNAFEYHRDSEKQEELKALHKLLPLNSSKAIFTSMVIDKAKAVFEIARKINALEKRTGVEITFRA